MNKLPLRNLHFTCKTQIGVCVMSTQLAVVPKTIEQSQKKKVML
jgi:hypothetical protein